MSGQDQLTWTAATDNIGVTAYDIYRNGIFLVTVGPTVTSYTDSTVATGVRNTYQVAARDLAGNTTSASVTTGGKKVTTAPTAPSKLTAASPPARWVTPKPRCRGARQATSSPG